MMINIEGNPFRSIIGFKDAAGNTHAFLVQDFADQSEHIELAHCIGTVVPVTESQSYFYGKPLAELL